MDPVIGNIIVAVIGAAATISVAILSRPTTKSSETQEKKEGNKFGTIVRWILVVFLFMASANYLFYALDVIVNGNYLERQFLLVPLVLGFGFLVAAIWSVKRVARK
jgi:Kef-type K+ transport system membrane component KefB